MTPPFPIQNGSSPPTLPVVGALPPTDYKQKTTQTKTPSSTSSFLNSLSPDKALKALEKPLQTAKDVLDAIDWMKALQGGLKMTAGGALAVGSGVAATGACVAEQGAGLLSAGTLTVPMTAACAGGAAVAGTGIAAGYSLMQSGMKDLVESGKSSKAEPSKTRAAPPEKMTNSQAREAAEKLGFKEVKDGPFNSHGALKFKNGNKYITPDQDGHSRGIWKMFDQKSGRMGTFDKNLNPVKR